MNKVLKTTAYLLLLPVLLTTCQKSGVSNIPFISFTAMAPNPMQQTVDTVAIEFSIIDGTVDIGVVGGNTTSAIYFQDSRYDTGKYFPNPFPIVDPVAVPANGLQGTCIFYPVPQPQVRQDTIHKQNGDTLTYRIYITDQAGRHSDTIITPPLIIKP